MAVSEDVTISLPHGLLGGTLVLPEDAVGVAVFAHGTGSSRHSPRNRSVAGAMNERGIATLLMDLLTEDEERAERATGHVRFDVAMLAERLGSAVAWVRARTRVPLGLFGASTGAAAALVVAASDPEDMRAVVSRGGRPDLAGDALARVRAPTLLIVGGLDTAVIALNERARDRMTGTVVLRVVPGASHLFEEPGALEQVAALAGDWFERHLHP